MSKNMGPLAYGEKQEEIFIGRDIVNRQNYSESTSQKIDSEIKTLVSSAHEKAREILTEKRDVIERVAKNLLIREILDGAEIDILLAGGELPPPVISVKQKVKEKENKETKETAVEKNNIPLPVPAPVSS